MTPVTGDWPAVLLDPGAGFAPALLGYARQRRWFRGKARTVESATIQSVLPLGDGPGSDQLVLFSVTYAGAAAELYVVPLGFAQGEQARSISSQAPHAVVSALGEGLIHDALCTAALPGSLLAAVRQNRAFRPQEGGGALEPVPVGTLAWPAAGELAPRMSSAEQSNTNVIFGRHLIMKVFRCLVDGINPEYEMGRFLSEHGFTATAPMEAALEYRAPGHEPATLAIVQRFVPNQGDAWAMTLETLAGTLDRLAADGNAEAAAGYVVLAEKLGRRTGELHVTLGSDRQSPAFAPEPWGAADAAVALGSARRLAADTFQLLRQRLGQVPAAVRELATTLSSMEGQVEQRLAVMGRPDPLLMRIRCHGDYHLGQVLCSGDDFVIIDFEGEPARPLSERRAKRCALVDVAGMLRSFDYAAASGLRSRLASVPADADPGQATGLARAAELWRGTVWSAYLRGYHGATRGADFLPRTDAATGELLDALLLEKCIYEVAYELNNRPDWLEIPLRGLERLLLGTPAR
jgi:maltose alpha-D-glucosyltransferase/alpha-amylase